MHRYTMPSTDAERAYYSIHHDELQKFGIAAGILQIIHTFIAWAAWKALVGSGLDKMLGEDHWVTYTIALVGVLTCHYIFATSWRTYWYDRWDKSAETDSHWLLPVILAIVLVWTEKQGIEHLSHRFIGTAEITSDTTYTAQNATLNLAATNQYAAQKAEIEAVCTAARKATRATYAAQIAAQERKTAKTEADRRYIRSKVSRLQTERDAALAAHDTQKAASLASLNHQHNQVLAQNDGNTSKITTAIAAANQAELQRIAAQKAEVSKWAWGISAILLIIIAYLHRKVVRINVKSGRIPLHTLTELDQRGGIWDAIADALKRQHARLATAIHRRLSAGTIARIDDRLTMEDSEYNRDPKKA